MHAAAPLMPITMSHCRRLASPLGELTLCADGDRLCAVLWPEQASTFQANAFEVPQGIPHGVLDSAADQLTAYFQGDRQDFSLPLAPCGTAFQQSVWSILQKIPFGETVSYGELAERMGRPQAARAVGRGVGSNLLAIVIPCHRVVGKNGQLTGFAGGLERKRRLLALESSNPLGV